ncbi:MAG TPA: ABC transporter substrate-binding protein [Burkholderiales bacterium]|jgi:phospholipid transport system substrate-binding protein|nr:ABC transporter substrate-binding protein [Burkholderiales bacterium]
MKIANEVLAAFVALILIIVIVSPAGAETLSPEALVKQVAADVLGATRKDKDKAVEAGDKREGLALAEEKILPHVDFAEATRLAASAAWGRASPVQQVQMVSAFRAMLVRTYSNTIDAYRDQTMRVLPAKMVLRAKEAVVHSEYVRPGEAPVGVEYAMRKSAGEWKIYDIAVEGVSLVLTYRPLFDHVTRTEGVDGLVRRLRENGKPRPSLTT